MESFTQDAARARLEHLSSLSIAKLKQEAEKEKEAGSFTPETQGLYKELAGEKLNQLEQQLSAMSSKEIAREFERGLAAGDYDEGLAPVIEKGVFASKFKEERARTKTEKTGIFLKSAASMVGNELAAPFTERESQVVKPFVVGAAKAGRDIVSGMGFTGASSREQLQATYRAGSAIELGTRETVGLVRDIFDDTDDDLYEAKGDQSLGEIFRAKRERMRPLVLAARGEGSFGTKAGTLEPVPMSEEDKVDIQEMSEALDTTNLVPFGTGFRIGTKGVSRTLKGLARATGSDMLIEGAEKVARAADKLPTGPKQQILGTPLLTAEEALERAAKTDGLMRKARLASGKGTVAFGQKIQEVAKMVPSAGATGFVATGATLAMGGDVQEALTAGLVAIAGRKVIGSRAGLYGVGRAIEGAGKFAQRPIPLPFKKARSAIDTFRADYKPFQSALAAAGAGAAETGLIALGADSPEEAGALVGGGISLAGAGSAFGTVQAFGRNQFIKTAAGTPGVSDVKAVNVEPLGFDADADKINQETVAQLSPAGSVFLQTARKILPDQHVYVALTGDQAQQIFTKLTGSELDVRNVNGVNAKAKDGRELVIIRPAGIQEGITGEAGGHEVTHALQQLGEADPQARKYWFLVQEEAAKALGPENGETFQDVKAAYLESAPAGTTLSYDEVVKEFIAEHGSVILSGLPAGKLGGSKSVAQALTSAFLRLAETLGLRKVGYARDGLDPVTSSALPYTPSFNLLDALERAIGAARLEKSDLVPDASVPPPAVPPVETNQGMRPVTPKTFDAGQGILNPVPAELATDQSLGTTTPPQQPTVETEAAKPTLPPKEFLYTVQRGEGDIPGYVQIDDITDGQNRESGDLKKFRERGYDLPDVPESLPQGQYTLDQIREAAAKEVKAEQPVNAAVRGQDVQAARTNVSAPLTAQELRVLESVQPDEAKRPVAKQAWEHIKAVGGQRIGIPIVEATINQEGVLRSKRIAPYAVEISSTGKATVISVDLDRVNYNAGLLFDWAGAQSTPEGTSRFGYTGVNDPKFITDLQTYLRNHAEGRRGSGEPLIAEGIAPATGEPVAKLTRDQELFFSTVMGQTPPAALTNRSLAAIARINATARASGIEPRQTDTGSVEPNSLRDQLRKEGAPIDRIGEDPDPARRQSNPKDRNSVVARIRLQDFESFTPTGQSTSQPNIRAIEASFMPPASKADAMAQKNWLDKKAKAAGFGRLEDAPPELFSTWAKEWRELQTDTAPPVENVEQAKFREFKKFFTNVTKGTFGKSEKPFVPEIAFAEPALLDTIAVKQKHSGNFDDHIMKSIPTFYEAQIGTIHALSKALPRTAKVLDIAASEGSWGKALTELSGVKTVSLDPNLEMARFFDEKSKVAGAEYSTEAFGASFEDDGRVVPQHDPVEKYDAIHEAMGFQFISPDRDGQIAEAKRLLKPEGILVTEQKLKNAGWSENEKFKDTNHKNKYFTTEELAAKDRVVGFSSDKSKAVSQSKSETAAVGMVANQVEQTALEGILSDNFEYVTQYWDSGNFMGYVAGDNKAAVDKFVANLPDLKSKFSRAETPRVVQDGKVDVNDESVEAQSLKAEEAVENVAPRFMPAASSLANTKVKGPDVQFKRATPLKGAVGGVLEAVHFSSKETSQIDPKKSFGKGAATKTDRMGSPKVFFYKKGTAYEAPIAVRTNVYEAKVDGNSIYDFNKDELNIQGMVNRAERDEVLRKAGFKGFYVESDSFDAIAIFDPINVSAVTRQDVMTPRQMKALGLTEQEQASAGDLSRTRIVRSPEYAKASARIAKQVGSSTNGAYFDAMDQWVEVRVNNSLAYERLGVSRTD